MNFCACATGQLHLWYLVVVALGILGQAEGMIMLNLSHAHSELDSLQALVEARRFGSGRSQ